MAHPPTKGWRPRYDTDDHPRPVAARCGDGRGRLSSAHTSVSGCWIPRSKSTVWTTSCPERPGMWSISPDGRASGSSNAMSRRRTASRCSTGPMTSSCTSPRPPPPADYARQPLETLAGARVREHAGPRPSQRRTLPARFHLGGVRRPVGPPPDRGLLGQRQPGGPAQSVRRSQALRRSADPHTGTRASTPSSSGVQHLWPADAAQGRPGGTDLRHPGAAPGNR